MKIGYAGNPVITESGQIFFTSSLTGVTQLYRLTDDGWPYQLTVFDDGIGSFSLSPDGAKVIISATEGGNEDYQLYLMDTRTGEIRQLTHRPQVRFGTVIWKKDKSGIYYRANLDSPRDFMIYYHDLETGQTTRIMEMEGSNGIMDISPDGKFMMTYRANSNISIDLFLLDLSSLEYRQLTPKDEEYIYDYATIMPGNKTAYMISNKNDKGILSVAAM